jgi:hypothetical protein
MKKNPFKVQMTEREKELMAAGRPVVCPACREVSALYPIDERRPGGGVA